MSASHDLRQRAARVLARVETSGAYAARLLSDAPPLVRELVLGSLRWQRTLDYLLALHLRRPLEALDPLVRAVLRVGVYEAKRLSTPAPVVVAEAVRVAKAICAPAAGLVNAVLRRVVPMQWPPVEDTSLPLGLRYSHPDWLVERWRQLLGEEQLEAALAADQKAAPLTVLTADHGERQLEEAGCLLAAHPWSPAVRVVTHNAEAAVRAVARGGAYALDPTAALVALLAPQIPGMPSVDVTAAPGGKLLVLAKTKGGWLLGADQHLGRVLLLRRNLRVQGCAAAVVSMDAALPALAPGRFGLVVVDAPCAGTGTLRRHPEIRWRLQPKDLAGLAAIQRRILAGASQLVAPGGYLLYATCSLEPEENEEVVADLTFPPEPLTLPAAVPAVKRPSGGVVILPSSWGDGFTVHLFRRPA